MSTPTVPQPHAESPPPEAVESVTRDSGDEEVVERALPGRPYRNPSRLAILIGLLGALWLWRGPIVLIVIGAVVLMIFFHELGHYLAARRSNMLVTEFFIGFGPRIFSFVRGETEYGLKSIPAGAYVKIIGMANVEEVAPELEDRTYRRGTYFERVRLAFAGPASHFIMAFFLLFGVLAFQGSLSEDSWRIRSVAEGSSADDAGVQVDDQLTELAGEPISTFDEMADVARENAGLETTVVVNRGGEEIALPVTINERLTIFGTIGQDLVFYRGGSGDLAVTVPEDSPIGEQGLVDGAVVTAIDGEPVATTEDVRRVVNASSDGILEFELSSPSGSTVSVDLGKEVEAGEPSGFFGVGRKLEPVPVGVVEAVPESATLLADVTGQTLAGLGRFFTPASIGDFFTRAVETRPGDGDEVSSAEPAAVTASNAAEEDSGRVMSIVGAVAVGEQLTEQGWTDLLLFMVQLNIVIGLFNLIPLPPFDGGHILVATYEKFREMIRHDGKRYISDANKLMPVAYGVLGFFMLLGVMALYLDLADPVQL